MAEPASVAAPVPAQATAGRAALRAPRVTALWWLISFVVVAGAVVAGLTVGPAPISPRGALLEVADRLPLLAVDSGLSDRDATIVWELRMPRVVLGLMVGALLSLCGASYQGAFRNHLADPYLLGVAAGAGLGATIAIVNGIHGTDGFLDPVPLFAFAGGLVAVAATYTVGAAGGPARGPATLVLAGVAVTSLFTAVQTYVQQRESESIREVYAWILGRLGTQGWDEVVLLAPYAALTGSVLLLHRRALDVLALGDEEARALGLQPARVRLLVVVAASLGTAAAVSVSGLIGFVGIIVPHTVRLLAGTSNRVVLPLSIVLGGAFLALADLAARTVDSPAELPIGVVTAFFGAPFFVIVLRTSRRSLG